MLTNLDKVCCFPRDKWHEEPSSRWLELCNQLGEYLCNQLQKDGATTTSPEVKDVSRKWELVSAYQKSVRRGLTEEAMWLAATFLSLPSEEWAYCWRRICTTSAEDVGYGDSELMNFVIACSISYRPNVGADVLQKVWSFLTEKMCQTTRSRIYCQLSIIEEAIEKGGLPNVLNEWETEVVKQLQHTRDFTQCPKAAWALQNDWRGEGMLKFQATVNVFFQVEVVKPDTKYELLCGLPDFCYDKHTRVGKAVCTKLCGHGPIKEFLTTYGPKAGKGDAVGWALFFAEGGKIANGLEDPQLSLLEAKVCAIKFGWTLAIWQNLVKLVSEAVASGKVNEIRKSVLLVKG